MTNEFERQVGWRNDFVADDVRDRRFSGRDQIKLAIGVCPDITGFAFLSCGLLVDSPLPESPHQSTRQYARIVGGWVSEN